MPPTSATQNRIPGLSSDLQKEVDVALLDCLNSAISSCADRNELFRRWDAQLRGDPSWAGLKPRNQKACYIEDPITREHHLTLVANIMTILRQEQWWLVNPIEPGDEDAAGQLEAWLNDKIAEYHFNGLVGYDLAYNAARYTYAVLYCGWKQDYSTNYETRFKDSESGEVVEAEDRLPGRQYKETEQISEDLDAEGLDIRVPDPSDVYFWPPDAQTVEQAEMVFERTYMSAGELLDGIDDYEYDADAVASILTSGMAQNDNTYQTDANERDGIAATSGADDGAMYEVYFIFGRPPALMQSGRSTLKNDIRRRNYFWVVSKEENVVLKCVPMPFKKKPYVMFPFLGIPGRLLGDSVCSMLQALQIEATIALRFRVDTRDIATSPTLMVPDTLYPDLSRYTVFPGAMIPYNPSGGLQNGGIFPLEWDKAGIPAAANDSQDFRLRAAQLFSAQARGSIQTHERTATQINTEAAGAADKFGLILMNFQIGIAALGELMISHYQQFGFSGQPDGQAMTQQIGAKQVSISPEMLAKKFRILTAGSSEDADPQARISKAEALYEFMMQNPIITQRAQQGDMTAIYMITTVVLRALGVRSPQSVIGPEPTPPPTPEQTLQTLLPVLQQYANAGDPGCQAVLQMLQQMMQSTQGGGGGQGGQQQGVQGKVSESVNYKDLAPNQKDAMAQQIGLPPAGGQQGQPVSNGVGGAH